MRLKIEFELVEDTDKQERDFGVSKEQLKRFHGKREQFIQKHIEDLKQSIKENYTFEDYEWVENLKVEIIEVDND